MLTLNGFSYCSTVAVEWYFSTVYTPYFVEYYLKIDTSSNQGCFHGSISPLVVPLTLCVGRLT